MITINELLTRNEEMRNSEKKFYDGVDEFCKAKGEELDAKYVEFDEVGVGDKNGTITADLTGMCCANGDVYFFEDGDPNECFYPENIDPNDLMDVLVSLRDTGIEYEFD
ncbi:MAG: hypothetical protein LUD72_12235 [Bacteroidales bacterium]|nr:hypothetical protein [Bacteroidales bacterium]